VERNRDLNLLLEGHCKGGKVEQVWSSLSMQPAVKFQRIEPHRHAFAFADGIYIGFIHSGGVCGGNEFRGFWRGVEQKSFQCARNFGEDPEFIGTMTQARRDCLVAADVFLTYEEADTFLPTMFTCRKFFNQPAQMAMQANHLGIREWTDISTPTVQYVMDCQWGDPGAGQYDRAHREKEARRVLSCPDLDKHCRDVSRLVYALLGRLFFPVDSYSASSGEPELDSRMDIWHAAMVFKGEARTGKSSFGLLIKEYMHNSEVASITNRSEDIFGLEGIVGKHLAMCLEVKKDFNMDTAVMQQMITGETVSVAKKFQVAENNKNWTTPLLFACNELAESWDDAKGALARRLIVINFPFEVPSRECAPVKINGDLHTHVHKSPESAALLRKMYCAYMCKLDDFGDRDLVKERPQGRIAQIPQSKFDSWPLPKGIHMWIGINAADMDVMRSFLLDENVVARTNRTDFVMILSGRGFSTEIINETFEALHYVPFDRMVSAASEYVRQNGTRSEDKRSRKNYKDLQNAIDSNAQCRLSYVDSSESPSRLLNWNEPNDAEEHTLFKSKPPGGKLVQGGTLKAMLATAQREVDILAKPSRRGIHESMQIMIGTLLACSQQGTSLAECATKVWNEVYPLPSDDDAEPPPKRARAGGSDEVAALALGGMPQ
jgi:hypothetical protein